MKNPELINWKLATKEKLITTQEMYFFSIQLQMK